MKHEEIDVIIPVYRPDEKLHRLLLALERQTVKPVPDSAGEYGAGAF